MYLSRLLIIITLLLSTLPVLAAEGGDSGLNSEILSAGVVHSDGYYLPKGLTVPISLNTPIDTRLTSEGDQITAQVTEDILVGDYVIIPANSFVHGYVSKFSGPGRFGRDPKLEVSFDTISLPSGQGRRFVNIKASVKQVALQAKSAPVTDGRMSYKTKQKIFGATAGVGGAITAYGVTEFVRPFASYGIGGMLDNVFILGSGLTGAYVASKMITKDNIRIETGTQLTMMLDEPALETFGESHMLSQNLTRKIEEPKDEISQTLAKDPGLAYDEMSSLKSIPLNYEN